MQYFLIEPEVAGGLGSNTILDRSRHPPAVTRLHYQLDGWLGDAILESFPAFIVTVDARDALEGLGSTGVEFAEVEVTTSDTFEELHPGRELPDFVWLKPKGEAGRDDFGVASDGRLVVSERVLGVLRDRGLSNALVEPFDLAAS